MTTWAIGDVHGCLTPLCRLIDAVNFDPARDRLWFVGDLANRGREPLATLRYIKALGDGAVTVLGNHDLHLLAVINGVRKASSKDTLDSILDAPDRDELEHWLRHRPLMHTNAKLGVTMVHAGIHPEWSLQQAKELAGELHRIMVSQRYPRFLERMYGDTPLQWSTALLKHERRRFAVNVFTRMRYVRRDGSLVFACSGPPADAPKRLLPWYRVPGRIDPGLRIVFGHWSSHPAMSPASVLPLDRGCVWNGTLAAHALEDGRTISVQC